MSEAIDTGSMGGEGEASGEAAGAGAQLEAVETPAATPAEPAGPAGAGSLLDALKDEPAKPATPAPTLPDWMKDWSTEDVAYAQNKGWHKEGKGPLDVLKAYRMAESKIGGDPTKDVRLPGDWNDEKQVALWRESIGAPKDPTGYAKLEINTSRGALETEPIAKIASELALMPWQYEKLGQLAANLVDQTASEQDAQRSAAHAAEIHALKAEWGSAVKQHQANVQKGVAALGLSREQDLALTDVLGARGALEFYERVGTLSPEHKPAENEGTQGFEGVMSPDVAKARLKLRMADKDFFAKLEANNPEAITEWQNLQAAAANRERD